MADRRSLLDGDNDDGRRSIREGMDVFDDEFEVEDFDVVADGFRPGMERRSNGGGDDVSRQDHDRNISTIAAHYASQPVTPTSPNGPSRNSTRKSRTYANPFASPEDEADTQLRRTPSGNFTTQQAHRSVSSASSSAYASTHSPRMATGGPSHPYGMYPQGTMARTPSIATQSTIRPQRSSSVRGGPTHPYTLYPQGIDDDRDLEDEHSSPQQLVPVGFPGLGQSYQRRVGPEGEDQDLIGDFGHTEQLPPYTRYPEDGPEKPLLGVPDPPAAIPSRAPVQGSDPGNPLMHAHLLPQQRQSMSDESNLQRQHSVASRRSMLPALHAVSSSDTTIGKKSWNEKTWQERRRTRMLCGIPFIWLAILLAALLFIGALVGGVLGGYVVGSKKGTRKAEAAASTSMYDASLIATPTTVPLPTGTFAMPFGPPEQPDASCLVSAAQEAAWSCNFGGDPNTMINIGQSPYGNETGAFLYAGVDPTTDLLYGLQVSSMQTQFEPFLLVSDRDDPDNGHAYYFQTVYDKIVVLPGDALSGGVSKAKVKREYIEQSWGVTQDIAEIGDKPWFCFWNKTSVEVFIYADKPIFAASTPSSTTAKPTSSSVSSYSAASQIQSGSYTKPAWASSTPTAVPSQHITTTFEMPTTTCTYTGEASALPEWLHENYPDYEPSGWLQYHDRDGDGIVDEVDEDFEGDDIPKREKRFEDISWMAGQSIPVFPYLIKIEERRKEGAAQAYCNQYQLLNDGTYNWIPDPDDDSQPITVKLEENLPSYEAYSSSQQRRKRSPDGACHCQWMSGLNS